MYNRTPWEMLARVACRERGGLRTHLQPARREAGLHRRTACCCILPPGGNGGEQA